MLVSLFCRACCRVNTLEFVILYALRLCLLFKLIAFVLLGIKNYTPRAARHLPISYVYLRAMGEYLVARHIITTLFHTSLHLYCLRTLRAPRRLPVLHCMCNCGRCEEHAIFLYCSVCVLAGVASSTPSSCTNISGRCRQRVIFLHRVL